MQVEEIKLKTTNTKVQKEKSLSGEKKDPNKKQLTSKFDIQVCRFIQIYPSAVVAMHYLKQSNLLAVARQNNSIQLWNMSNQSIRVSIPTRKNQSIRRLLSFPLNSSVDVLLACCENSDILLIDCQSGSLMSSYQVNGGFLWDADLLIKQKSEKQLDMDDETIDQMRIITSTSDGIVRILSFDENFNSLRFQGSTRSYDAMSTCVCYGGDQGQFYAGYENSFVRKFTAARVPLFNLSLSDSKTKKVIPWQLKYVESLKNLAVGCSDGNMRLFEVKFCTLLKIIQTHESDITCLAIHPRLDYIYATGSDSKIVVLAPIQGDSNSWKAIANWRGQSHDIYALEFVESASRLLSGGLTTDITHYNIDNITGTLEISGSNEKTNGHSIEQEKTAPAIDLDLAHLQFKRTLGLGQFNGDIMSSKNGEYLFVKKDYSLELWRVGQVEKQFEFIIKIESAEQILCCDLSFTGEYLAYSTFTQSFIFHRNDETHALTKMRNFESCLKFRFVNDQNNLVALAYNAQNSPTGPYLKLLKVKNSNKDKVLFENLSNKLINCSHFVLNYNTGDIILGSQFNKYMARFDVLHSTDIIEIPIFFQNHSFTCFNFVKDNHHLAIVYENFQIVIFNLRKREMTNWTKRNLNKLNFPFKKNIITNVMSHPSNPMKLLLINSYQITSLDQRYSFQTQQENTNNQEQATGLPEIQEFQAVKLDKPLIHSDTNGQFVTIFQIDFNRMIDEQLPLAINSKQFVS